MYLYFYILELDFRTDFLYFKCFYRHFYKLLLMYHIHEQFMFHNLKAIHFSKIIYLLTVKYVIGDMQ